MLEQHLGTLLYIVAAVTLITALALTFISAKTADEYKRTTYAIITVPLMLAAAMFFIAAVTHGLYLTPGAEELLEHERMVGVYEGLKECRIQYGWASQ